MHQEIIEEKRPIQEYERQLQLIRPSAKGKTDIFRWT